MEVQITQVNLKAVWYVKIKQNQLEYLGDNV